MVNMLRLDERLIHGQVATKWVKAYPYDSILVVDDDTVKDPLSIKTLQMAAMSISGNIKTFIKNTDDALKILCDPRCKTRKVFVVCRQVSTLLEIATKAPDIEQINLGNYGRMVISEAPRKAFTRDLLFNEEELELARKVAVLDLPVYHQNTPDTERVDARNLLGC